MDNNSKAWLYDILNAIIEIEGFLGDDLEAFIHYKNDIKTKRAVERNIKIIGEALNRILQKDATTAISNARKIVDTRNRIIHAYDSVSDDVIWSIVITHLPILLAEVKELLGE
jgi:uncharacterized protein with HEPN domain